MSSSLKTDKDVKSTRIFNTSIDLTVSTEQGCTKYEHYSCFKKMAFCQTGDRNQQWLCKEISDETQEVPIISYEIENIVPEGERIIFVFQSSRINSPKNFFAGGKSISHRWYFKFHPPSATTNNDNNILYKTFYKNNGNNNSFILRNFCSLNIQKISLRP
jgi:hypothetical protein